MGSRSLAWLAFLGGLIVTLLVVLIVVLANDNGEAPAGATAPSTVPSDSTAATGASGTTATSVVPATTAAAGATSTPAPAPPATTVPPATTSPSTTEAIPVNRCTDVPPMAIPTGAVGAGGANGVFGGGPEPESVMDADFAHLFESGGNYFVAFSLNVGYVAFQQLPEPIDPAFVPELLVVNFDGNDDAAWVKIDRSLAAGAEVYAFYFLDESCAVEDAGTAGVPRYEFLDWGGLEHTQGFTCVGDGVFETFAGVSSTPGRWDVTSSFFQWTAPALPGFLAGVEDGLDVPDGDPSIAAAGVVDC